MNAERAYQLAGITGLVRSGMTADAAANQLGIIGSAREQLLSLVDKHV